MSQGFHSILMSRSLCIDYWKSFLAHNCFPFTTIVMKLNMQTLHEPCVCTLDIWGRRIKDLLKMVSCLHITAFPLHLSSWNFRHKIYVGQGCALDFRDQRSRSQCIDYWKWFLWYNCFYTYCYERSHTNLPWVKDVHYRFRGQNVMVTVHWLLEMVSGS